MSRRYYLILLGLISLPVIYPLTGTGYILTHDQYFPIHRLVALHRCLMEGQFPPRWTDLFALGYGYPFFNFYAPLAYYLSELLYLLTHHYVLSIHLVFGFSLIFGGVGIYYWVKDILDENSALVAATIYIYIPYHLVNAYVRGDISELISSAFFPWAFWSFYKISLVQNNNKKWILISAIFYAFIMLSHNIMALLFTGFIFTYILFLAYTGKNRLIFKHSLLGIIWGLGLSAYFWMPAFMEKKYVQISALLSAASYSEHYVYPLQFVSLYWGYGGSNPGPNDGMSFQLGIISLFLSLCALFLLFTKRILKGNEKKQVVYFWVMLFLIVFLMLPFSQWIWDILPLLHYTLFPWRLLSLAGIPLTILSAFAVFWFLENLKTSIQKNIIVFICCLLTISFVIPYLQKRQIPFSNELVTRTNIWKTEMISRTFGTTMSNEYLPIGVKVMPSNPSSIFIQTEEGLTVPFSPNTYKSTLQQYTIQLQTDKKVVFALFYFPGWSLWVDKRRVDIQTTPNGFISAMIPAGEHIIDLKFENTPVRKLANGISILCLLVAGIVGLQLKMKR